jgi:hypothetical protein
MAYFATLKTEEALSSEASITLYQTVIFTHRTVCHTLLPSTYPLDYMRKYCRKGTFPALHLYTILEWG